MKKSAYNLQVNNGGYFLIYNQLCSSATVLNKDTYDRFLNDNLTAEEQNNLTNRGVLVLDDCDEVENYLSKRRQFRQYDKEHSIIYRLLVTTACNAACYYCYEKNLPKQNMTDAVASRFLERVNVEAVNKKIILEWFGGEPLLRFDLIKKICTEVKALENEIDCSFESHIISNGHLFCESSVRDNLDILNLKRVQITLDGTKEIYEKTKQYNVNNAFETVIDNIEYLLSRNVFVDIRLNYSHNTLEDILSLIDYLAERFGDCKNINVYSHHIFDDNCTVNNLDEYKDSSRVLTKKLYEAGLIKNIWKCLSIRMGCQANRRNGGTIMPNGDLFRCSLATMDGKLSLGNIADADFSVNEKWVDDDLSEKCKQCKYLPVCGGGCTYSKIKGDSYCLVNEHDIESILLLILDNFIKNKGGYKNVEH